MLAKSCLNGLVEFGDLLVEGHHLHRQRTHQFGSLDGSADEPLSMDNVTVAQTAHSMSPRPALAASTPDCHDQAVVNLSKFVRWADVLLDLMGPAVGAMLLAMDSKPGAAAGPWPGPSREPRCS